MSDKNNGTNQEDNLGVLLLLGALCIACFITFYNVVSDGREHSRRYGRHHPAWDSVHKALDIYDQTHPGDDSSSFLEQLKWPGIVIAVGIGGAMLLGMRNNNRTK